MHFVTYFSCCFVSLLFQMSAGLETEVESMGQFRPVTQREVEFRNNYHDAAITVFWTDSTSKVKMFDIEPQEYRKINTVDGHRFVAEKINTDGQTIESETNSDTIIIVEKYDVYYFGSSVSSISTAGSGRNTTRLHPLVKIIGQKISAMSAKFRCLVPATDYYYENGLGGTFQGTLILGKETTTNTYEGHVFFFTERGNKDNEIARFTMTKDQVLYVISDPKFTPPADLIAKSAAEEVFMKEYYDRTGLHWRHYFGPDGPRPAPTLFMWPASAVGDIYTVESEHGYWSCSGSVTACQSPLPVRLELEVVSLRPRVFIISDFLSDYEVEQIKVYAGPRMKESEVGSRDGAGERKADTRTSRNSWVSRQTSDITETLFRRAANLLQVDHTILQEGVNAEHMQVVHYVNGQKYDAHHDWGVSGYPESRLITLLLYLTDQPDPHAGGETAFPKGADGMGFKVAPKKGCAVLFYNLLEDGNGDDLALHAALPVHHGEKWLANFWVWDPHRHTKPSP